MVDPFIDPLDTAPVTSNKSLYSSPRRVLPSRQEQSQRLFHEILRNQVKQEPTPIMMPDALEPPQLRPNSVQSKANPSLETEKSKEQSASNYDPLHGKAAPTPLPELRNNPIQQPLREEDLKDNLKNHINNKSSSVPLDIKDANEEEPQTETAGTGSEDFSIQSTEKSGSSKDNDVEDNYQTEQVVQPGDTLSGIVASALREKGADFRTSDIYRLVNVVAEENGIRNPDVIYAGSKIDLSAVYSDNPIATGEAKQTAFLGDARAPANGRITSEFGMRMHPVHNEQRFHKGLDIAMDEGTPVHSFKAGVVRFAGEMGGYGKLVEVEHADGSRSRYGHLSQVNVQEGETVDMNKPIGLSGNTGISTGPHLHFEVSQNGQAIDPLTLLPVEMIEAKAEVDGTRMARGELRQANV